MGERLLIVDDNEFIRSITQNVLEQAGCPVEAAEDGLADWEEMDGDPSQKEHIIMCNQNPKPKPFFWAAKINDILQRISCANYRLSAKRMPLHTRPACRSSSANNINLTGSKFSHGR